MFKLCRLDMQKVSVFLTAILPEDIMFCFCFVIPAFFFRKKGKTFRVKVGLSSVRLSVCPFVRPSRFL